MPSKARDQKCSILGPQTLGSIGGPGPRGPPPGSSPGEWYDCLSDALGMSGMLVSFFTKYASYESKQNNNI